RCRRPKAASSPPTSTAACAAWSACTWPATRAAIRGRTGWPSRRTRPTCRPTRSRRTSPPSCAARPRTTASGPNWCASSTRSTAACWSTAPASGTWRCRACAPSTGSSSTSRPATWKPTGDRPGSVPDPRGDRRGGGRGRLAGVVRAWARRLPGAAAACPHGVAVALFVEAVLVGLLAARLGYVLRWWPEYAAAPMSIVAIGDGGFLWWAGLPTAVAFAWWHTGKRLPLRRPLLAGIAAGMLAWAAFNGLLLLMQRSPPPLPAFELATLDGSPTTLAAHAGRPVVLNLWATWCPPCRREMPVLAEAQAKYPGVAFLPVNQGEDCGTLGGFLDGQGLAFEHLLLDPHSRTMLGTGTRGLPT